jgi:hypothetical protein
MSKGLSRNAAIAVTCCLWYESKLNPGSQGAQATERGGALNPTGAYGIASWNGPRQAALAAFAEKKGLSPAALETQLWFVLNEAANSYPKTWAAITGTGTYQEIIPIFVADYENPADHAAEINGALGFAAQLAPFVPMSAPTVAPEPTPISAPPVLLPAAPPSMQIGNIQMPIELVMQLVGPLAESLVSGLIKGALAHISTTTISPIAAPAHAVVAPVAPAAPMDFAQIAAQIAAELAKLQQPAPAA